jgi:hypothetical protein
MFDERLLAELDASDEVQQDGRSAVLRRAAEAYLRIQRRRSIAEQYQRAYDGKSGLGEEFEGWEEQGEWPPE